MKKWWVGFCIAVLAVSGLIGASPGHAQSPAPIVWKMQTVWPAGLAFHRNAEGLAKRIEEMSGGRLKIQVEPAGTVVGAFDVLDAVNKGLVDCAHGWSAYWVGKHPALNFFTSASGGPFGLDNLDYVSWMFYGGGYELYRELYQDVLKMKVHVIPTLVLNTEPLGWFKKPIKSVADLKGAKFRASGLTAEIYKELGMTVIAMPAGEILPALERGVIDGAEFYSPYLDKELGFQDVAKYYYAPGMHRSTGTLELLVNKEKWDKLPADLKAIIDIASRENLLRGWLEISVKDVEALEELKAKSGVNVVETPKDVLIEILKAWDKVAANYAAKDPFFAKVSDSMKQFASHIVPFRRDFQAGYDICADYYWPKK
jgi:TRAP-type mannitol/chloroaromatic compound transport system substrate-binding protein